MKKQFEPLHDKTKKKVACVAREDSEQSLHCALNG